MLKKVFILVAFSALISMNAYGTVITKVSGRLYHGSSYELNISSDNAVDTFEILWQELNVKVKAECEDKCTADVLMPLKYDQTGAYELRVNAIKDGKTVAASIEKITVSNKEYDIQKLSVDPMYVNPGQEAIERSAKERELSVEAMQTFTEKKLWSLPLSKPVDSVYTSPFGVRRMFNGEMRSKHTGLDFRAAVGVPIKAVAEGTVLIATNFYFAGNCVYIDHGQGVVSMYFHLSEILVKKGDNVDETTVIGKAGATGRVTGPHLHFSLSAQGVLVDPEPLF